jgi:hypothetical protein
VRRLKGCFQLKVKCKKIGYTNKKQANKAIRVVKETRSHFGLSSYKCNKCNKWHIGRKR